MVRICFSFAGSVNPQGRRFKRLLITNVFTFTNIYTVSLKLQVRRTLVNWGSGIFASKRSSDAPHAVRVGKDGKIKYVSIIYGKSIDIIYIPAKGLSKY